MTHTHSTRAGTCLDCQGTGQLTGTPAGNGLAMGADCPTCGGSGQKGLGR
ncbi:hypothetical protein ACIHFD_57550 [Nonomuraea sp. NPDC051941]